MFFFENINRFKKKFTQNYKINVSKKLKFGDKKTNDFFLKKLQKSKFYFEYGSGNTTLLAYNLKKNFVSIEADKDFFELIKKKIDNHQNLKYVDIGPVGEYSYPLIKNKFKIIRYIKSINKFFKKKKSPDLILIDGRFRIACCINIFSLIKRHKKKPLIFLDDYKKRKHYKVLKKIFKINQTGRMAILKFKKKSENNILSLNKYYYDSR
tara:strand:+ start:81 stop:707 length:627 start_codon:yes stop_codon:yes gene_type:complete